MTLTTAYVISLTVMQMCNGLISSIASGTVIIMIFRSEKKLRDPYRRIIFGISTFDIIFSITCVLRIFMTNAKESATPLALGNQTSCNILGFMKVAGINGALFYNVSLNIYYICLIKYNVTAAHYRNRVEPFLHAVPVLWAVVSSSTVVGTGHMNLGRVGECVIGPSPADCLEKPNVVCIRGENAVLYRLVFRLGPAIVAICGIIITLIILWWSVRIQERKMSRYKFHSITRDLIHANNNSETDGNSASWSFALKYLIIDVKNKVLSVILRSNHQNRDAPPSTASLPPSHPLCRKRRSSRKQTSNGRSFLIHAGWYVIAFLLTHLIPTIVIMLRTLRVKAHPILLVSSRIFLPLQGLFNILIYTRPHVNKERKKCPSLSWWAAFRIVVASGGDDDEPMTNRLRQGVSRRGNIASSEGQNTAHTDNRTVQNGFRNTLCRYWKWKPRKNGSGLNVMNHDNVAEARISFPLRDPSGDNEDSARSGMLPFQTSETEAGTGERSEKDPLEGRSCSRLSLRNSVLFTFDVEDLIALDDIDSLNDVESCDPT